MPTYEKGDMWSVLATTDLFAITTNSCIKRNGALVMGRGIAKVVRDRWPGIDIAAGNMITNTVGSMGKYGLLVSPGWPDKKLGLFQVKFMYSDQADCDLIDFSVTKLLEWQNAHPGKRVDLNFPGIGNGGLSIDVVKPIVDALPKNIHIWTFK